MVLGRSREKCGMYPEAWVIPRCNDDGNGRFQTGKKFHFQYWNVFLCNCAESKMFFKFAAVGRLSKLKSVENTSGLTQFSRPFAPTRSRVGFLPQSKIYEWRNEFNPIQTLRIVRYTTPPICICRRKWNVAIPLRLSGCINVFVEMYNKIYCLYPVCLNFVFSNVSQK